MTIDSILAQLQVGNVPVLSKDAHKSLAVFDSSQDPFYVEATYKALISEKEPYFIIFSAPGASGKSALAKYITCKYKGLYWDLSKIKLGDSSFAGTLWKAMKQEKMYQYWENLRKGKSVMALDAFDEAEMISGRVAIQTFLKDIYENIGNITTCTIFLFARTECADFIGSFFEQKEIPYSRYEIGFFTETNAFRFIEQSYIRGEHRGTKGKLNYTLAVDNCVKDIFSSIKSLLRDVNSYSSFLGYAPVLQAIEKLVELEQNTRRLQEKIMGSSSTSTGVIKTIMTQLLEREQEKVIEALKGRWEVKHPDFDKWDSLYSAQEQMCRIIEMVVFENYQEDSLYNNDFLDNKLKDDYTDVLSLFLPEHPFLQNIYGKDGINFTGPAFRDYTLAFLLSNEAFQDYAVEYFSEVNSADRYPSQLLYDFYYDFSDGIMHGYLFPILYESFKAKERKSCVSTVSISIDDSQAHALFSLQDGDMASTYQFTVNNGSRDLVIDRISNGYIDTIGRVDLGRGRNNCRVYNTTIFAKQIVFSSDTISFDTSDGGEIMLVCSNSIEQSGQLPKLVECHLSSKNSLKISAPNINDFYQLKKYQFTYDSLNTEEYFPFEIFLKKLLNCVRCHNKDVPAKDREFIQFVLIGMNTFRQKVMEFLLKEGIFFIDSNASHLYKLDTSALAQYQINWNNVFAGDTQGIKKLYQKYLESEKA